MNHYVSSSSNKDHSCVRSLLFFEASLWGHEASLSEREWVSKRFNLVRVLDLGYNYFSKVPSNWGLFIHLRYLKIYIDRILYALGFSMNIPDSICTLENLLTLCIYGDADKISFPSGIWNLKQLRHLHTNGRIIFRGHHSSKADDQVMWNLQTISMIKLNREIACMIEKGRFPKLRKLGLRISWADKDKVHELLSCLQRLTHLHKLKLDFPLKRYKGRRPMPSNYNEMKLRIGCKPIELLQTLQHLSNLTTLQVSGALDLPTCSTAFPACITKLKLGGIRFMNDDGMNAIGNLTRLRLLRLLGDYEVDNSFEINCNAGSFSQLQVFEMKWLNVKKWKLGNGAMPCLQTLLINCCINLKRLPDELWSLNSLRQVKVVELSSALSLELANLEMKDGCDLIVTDLGSLFS
ncbi:hypothetical protein PIB30_010140 [Stylosanthes scabra]|uniref:Disease resistance R13L4/SHOC-2-like LRR domain-containing protein n=1 Tax=Stylosanthes scabra TaxID=79078 RepID=A0ABU6Z265_9FABA|nr:hypothetical protein [Stylosanthes scabra]